MDFGDLLRSLRQKNKLSQQTMANYLGMSTPGYNKIENGKTNPSWERILQISRIFDIDPGELWIGPAPAPSDDGQFPQPKVLQMAGRITILEMEIRLKDEIILQLKKRLGEA